MCKFHLLLRKMLSNNNHKNYTRHQEIFITRSRIQHLYKTHFFLISKDPNMLSSPNHKTHNYGVIICIHNIYEYTYNVNTTYTRGQTKGVLWGCHTHSLGNIRFSINKSYVSNNTLHRDLLIPTVENIAKNLYKRFHFKLANHRNLIQNLSSQTIPGDPGWRLKCSWCRDLLVN